MRLVTKRDFSNIQKIQSICSALDVQISLDLDNNFYELEFPIRGLFDCHYIDVYATKSNIEPFWSGLQREIYRAMFKLNSLIIQHNMKEAA